MDPVHPPPLVRPTVAPRDFLIWSAIVHAVSFLLRTSYLWLDDLVREKSGTLGPHLLEEGSSAIGSYLLSWFVFVAWRAAPLRSPHFIRRLPGYLLLGVVLSATATSFMWGSRTLLFPLFGLGAYDYGQMPLRYLMELPGALIGFAILLGALALADEVLYRNRAETTRLELERGLVQSQLRSLRLQLQPHFLFNALNTIAAQVHVDAALADHLIGRLADLLRVSLRSTEGLVVPLHEELALLNAYADLMRARFGTRFCLEVQASAQTLDTPVPPLLLQPLVENAVRHGRLERDGVGHITVAAERTASHLVLTVHDDGPGIVAGRDPFTAGTGLSVTARRLALMFGDAAQITAANAAGGGFAVTMHMPSR